MTTTSSTRTSVRAELTAASSASCFSRCSNSQISCRSSCSFFFWLSCQPKYPQPIAARELACRTPTQRSKGSGINANAKEQNAPKNDPTVTLLPMTHDSYPLPNPQYPKSNAQCPMPDARDFQSDARDTRAISDDR
ncbi:MULTISPECIES: hypothetical protein [unclassified Microcoleus]|uniref:hypothetical protein n=1 Tax=unclassified Microcoleus TaxID=2642155 RepID=UPI002FD04DB8